MNLRSKISVNTLFSTLPLLQNYPEITFRLTINVNILEISGTALTDLLLYRESRLEFRMIGF